MSTDDARADGPGTFTCEMCGGTFELSTPGVAEAEAEANGIDPAECGLVCDECYALTPWGRQDFDEMERWAGR
jgi:hypothetical protein